MLKTMPGSTDGIRVSEYAEGVEYDLGATAGHFDLAQSFVATGMAEAIVDLEFAEDSDPQPGALIEPESPEAAAAVTKIDKSAKAKK